MEGCIFQGKLWRSGEDSWEVWKSNQYFAHLFLACVQTYPDVIAQCVYSTFIYAFPTSWNNFDDEFKNELCNIVSLWQVGEEQDKCGWL